MDSYPLEPWDEINFLKLLLVGVFLSQQLYTTSVHLPIFLLSFGDRFSKYLPSWSWTCYVDQTWTEDAPDSIYYSSSSATWCMSAHVCVSVWACVHGSWRCCWVSSLISLRLISWCRVSGWPRACWLGWFPQPACPGDVLPSLSECWDYRRAATPARLMCVGAGDLIAGLYACSARHLPTHI